MPIGYRSRPFEFAGTNPAKYDAVYTSFLKDFMLSLWSDNFILNTLNQYVFQFFYSLVI